MKQINVSTERRSFSRYGMKCRQLHGLDWAREGLQIQKKASFSNYMLKSKNKNAQDCKKKKSYNLPYPSIVQLDNQRDHIEKL